MNYLTSADVCYSLCLPMQVYPGVEICEGHLISGQKKRMTKVWLALMTHNSSCSEFTKTDAPPTRSLCLVLYFLIRAPIRTMTGDVGIPKKVASWLVMVLCCEWILKFIGEQVIPHKECVYPDNPARYKAVVL